MKVILLQDIKGTGKKDDVISVSDGYARNFLFPRGLAKEATKGVMSDLMNKQASADHRAEMELQDAKKAAEKIDQKTFTVKAKAGDGKLFGSVTAREIAAAIEKEAGITVDKRKISLDSDIKSFGTFEVTVKVHQGVSARVFVNVSEQ
jgi:ribosomal protein L9